MRLPVFILFYFIGFSLFAQSSRFRNQELSFSAGIAEISIEKFSPNENMDFMNYVDVNPDFIDFIIVNLGYKFDFLDKMSADLKLILMDDLIPDNYDVSVHYFFKPSLGIGIGSMLNKNYITFFEEYQIQTLTDYYLVDDNTQQFTAYDLGFYLSPALKPIDNEIFTLLFKCDLGISSFLKEKASFYHKKKLSNEKLHYQYETMALFQPYIQPKLELRLRAFKRKQTSFGVLLNSSYFSTRKSIDYTRTVNEWTMGESKQEDIQSPKHNFSRFEFDIGVFVRW